MQNTVIPCKHNARLTVNAKTLRKNMTEEERRLWYCFLREYPVRFYRQKVLGNYIADFFCAKAKLIVELDGSQHYEAAGKKYDEKRTLFLQEYDCTVLRIPNNEVDRNFRGVCEWIDMHVNAALEGMMTTPQSLCGDGSPCTGEPGD